VGSQKLYRWLFALMVAGSWRLLEGQALSTFQAGREVKHGVSQAVRDMRSDEPITQPEEDDDKGPLRIPFRKAKPKPGRDFALQLTAPAELAPLTILNFEGLGDGAYGSADTFIPPDTNGSPGLTQYVQWVNGEFAVFNKSTGAVIQSPISANRLWQSLGASDPCYVNNAGDIIAQYDKAANRWVMSQFTGDSGPPYYQCFAVSQTSDATGAYWLYEFAFTDYFNDYPKISVWPDAYYGTFNMFDSYGEFEGGRTCAFQRSSMLAGTAATWQCFTLPDYGGLLSSDLDGPTPPPSGAPNYVIGLDGSLAALDMFSFHVDWVTPGNSTFAGPLTLAVLPFVLGCNGESDNPGTCINQPGTTQQLDSLGDRMMYRLAYRNFGDHESLLVNHSVDTGTGNIGVRWYEIRNPSNSPAIYQESTYAPDTDSRWMGSMVMDHSGNIAMGYGVSSSATYPSIRFTGRQSFDPINTMESETSMATGTGSQIPQNGAAANRWGDYSNFAVDPVDDCTLWYTHEYMTVTGDFAWSTRIGNLKFGNCAPVNLAPTFSISATPAFSAYQDATAVVNLTVATLNGFSAAVSLSVNGVPAATVASLSPATIPAPGSGIAVLSIPILANTTPGTYSLVVTGIGGGLTESTTIQLTVMTAGEYNAMNDGGFELATVTGTGAPGWSGTVSHAGQDLIIFDGEYPHTGANYASFSGDGGLTEVDSLAEYIAIPAALNAAELSFWVNVTTSQTSSSATDTLTVTIQDENGVNHPQMVLSNLDAVSDANASGEYFQPSAINLLPWAGQTVQIIFTSSTASSTFLLDDVDLNIAESGGACSFTITPSIVYFDANTNAGTAGVTANLPYCTWTPGPDSSWITYNSPIGAGSSAFGVGVVQNLTGASRTGHITVGTASLTVTQDATTQVFTDVPPSSYYFDAVDLFSVKGITNGCGPTTYCPQTAVTRAEMAVFIVRMMLGTGSFPYDPTPYFSDVPVGAFAFEYIQKFYELGITAGCGPGLFCPNETVSREQMAVFIIKGRYGASTTFDYTPVPYFTDVPTGAFAFNYIQRMKEDGITDGCSATLYCPTNPVLRGDMAIFIMHGGFNALFPPTQPEISGISQSTIPNDSSATLTVTGTNTNFVQGTTIVNQIPGIFFGPATVVSPTSLLVEITAEETGTPRPISIWVTTGSQEVIFPNGIQIQ
jgi:hypothetical protein